LHTASRLLHRVILGGALLILGGCAAMTSVVLLDPGKQYPPAQRPVVILLKPPTEPYIEIAKLESRGFVGEAETVLLEDARVQAAKIGADAIIVLETTSTYQPPVIVHDPWPPLLPWYHDRWHGYRYWPVPPYYYPYMMEPMVFPGGNAYTVRTLAIRYK